MLQEYNSDLYPEIREQLLSICPYELGIDEKNRFKSVYSKYPIEGNIQLAVKTDDSQYNLFKHDWYSHLKNKGKEVLPVCSFIVRIGEKRIRIVNCHLMSNNLSLVVRNMRKERLDLHKTLAQVAKRIDFGYAVRKLQAEIICNHLNDCGGDFVIVCGDFNDISGSSTLRVFNNNGLKDAWWRGGLGFGFTFRGMGMRWRLDHLLFSISSLSLKRVFVAKTRHSDHYPLVADFTFNN